MNEQIPGDKVLDLGNVPCSSKHALVLQRWQETSVGDYFIIKNNHYPGHLYDQFKIEFPEAFKWNCVEESDHFILIKVLRLKETARIETFSTPSSCSH